MIVMLDTAQPLEVCQGELGLPVEQLFTPLTRRNPQKPEQHFAMDNGAFAKFDPTKFKAMLAKHFDRKDLCRWVAVPDVVGSAIRTLETWGYWSPQMQEWPLAFVCQDGQENLPIPWSGCCAIFIGGSTEWKMSKHVTAIIQTAKVFGKWIHVGRVNTPGRLEHFESLGVDSCDGTGLARYSDMRHKVHNDRLQPKFNFDSTLDDGAA